MFILCCVCTCVFVYIVSRRDTALAAARVMHAALLANDMEKLQQLVREHCEYVSQCSQPSHNSNRRFCSALMIRTPASPTEGKLTPRGTHFASPDAVVDSGSGVDVADGMHDTWRYVVS